MLESLNYSFRNPKKRTLSNLPHQTVEKLQENHGVLRGPQLGKQRWRARLGILRVNKSHHLCKRLRDVTEFCIVIAILLRPQDRVLLETLLVVLQSKNFPALCATHFRFHQSLSLLLPRAKWINSTLSQFGGFKVGFVKEDVFSSSVKRGAKIS